MQSNILFLVIMKKQLTLILLLLLVGGSTGQAAERWLEGYKKVLVIGAHPDDPETSAVVQ